MLGLSRAHLVDQVSSCGPRSSLPAAQVARQSLHDRRSIMIVSSRDTRVAAHRSSFINQATGAKGGQRGPLALITADRSLPGQRAALKQPVCSPARRCAATLPAGCNRAARYRAGAALLPRHERSLAGGKFMSLARSRINNSSSEHSAALNIAPMNTNGCNQVSSAIFLAAPLALPPPGRSPCFTLLLLLPRRRRPTSNWPALTRQCEPAGNTSS